jgi:DNA-binding NtrC family response regulator
MPDYSQIFINNKFYDKVIINSILFRRLYPIICCVSATDIPVLILGETGTWKPLFARIIHNNSRRKRGKLLVVDFRDSSKDSLEIELFGQDYRDFSHSKVRRIGKLEQANGGSILLNEIGEMPYVLQSRLLQVIQDQEIHSVGGDEIISTDVRIIATASKNLELAVKAGRFREDLYYRLAVFPITVPPLREYHENIEFLANQLFKTTAKRVGKPITNITSETMKILMNYDWPGNFQELANVIEYAVDQETSNMLQTSSLPEEISENGQPYDSLSKNHYKNSDRIIPLEEIERQALINALKITDNNVQLTAKALGINRATVYRKLGKYHLLEK